MGLVILALWPSLNPDGQTLVGDWYASNLGTPYEVAPMPWLYQKYVGHDNNRDAYMLNMIESRVIERTWRNLEPQIIHALYEASQAGVEVGQQLQELSPDYRDVDQRVERLKQFAERLDKAAT